MYPLTAAAAQLNTLHSAGRVRWLSNHSSIGLFRLKLKYIMQSETGSPQAQSNLRKGQDSDTIFVQRPLLLASVPLIFFFDAELKIKYIMYINWIYVL